MVTHWVFTLAFCGLAFSSAHGACDAGYPAEWQGKTYYHGRVYYMTLQNTTVTMTPFSAPNENRSADCVDQVVHPDISGAHVFLNNFTFNSLPGMNYSGYVVSCTVMMAMNNNPDNLVVKHAPIEHMLGDNRTVVFDAVMNATDCVTVLRTNVTEVSFPFAFNLQTDIELIGGVDQMLTKWNNSDYAAISGKISQADVDAVKTVIPYDFYSVNKASVQCPFRNAATMERIQGNFMVTMNNSMNCVGDMMSKAMIGQNSISLDTCAFNGMRFKSDMECTGHWNSSDVQGAAMDIGDFIMVKVNKSGTVFHHVLRFNVSGPENDPTDIMITADFRDALGLFPPGFDVAAPAEYRRDGITLQEKLNHLKKGGSDMKKPWRVENFQIALDTCMFPEEWRNKQYANGKFGFLSFGEMNSTYTYWGEQVSDSKIVSYCLSSHKLANRTIYLMKMDMDNTTNPFLNKSITVYGCMEARNLTADHSMVIVRANHMKGHMNKWPRARECIADLNETDHTLYFAVEPNQVRDTGVNVPKVLEHFNSIRWGNVSQDFINHLKVVFPYNYHSVKLPEIACPFGLNGGYQMSLNSSTLCADDDTSWGNFSTNSVTLRTCEFPYIGAIKKQITCVASWSVGEMLGMDDGKGDFALIQDNEGDETNHSMTQSLIRYRTVGQQMFVSVDNRNFFSIAPGFDFNTGADNSPSRPVGNLSKLFEMNNMQDMKDTWSTDSFTFNLSFTDLDYSKHGVCQHGFPDMWVNKKYTNGKFQYIMLDKMNAYMGFYGKNATKNDTAMCVDDMEYKGMWYYLTKMEIETPHGDFSVYSCMEVYNATPDHSVLVSRYKVFIGMEKDHWGMGMKKMTRVEQCFETGLKNVTEISLHFSYQPNEIRDIGYNIPDVLSYLNASMEHGRDLLGKVDKKFVDGLRTHFPHNIHSYKRPASQCPWTFPNGNPLSGSFQLSEDGSKLCADDDRSYVNISSTKMISRSCVLPFPVTLTCTDSWKAADILGMDDGKGDFVMVSMNGGNDTHHDITYYLGRWKADGDLIHTTSDSRNRFGLTPGFNTRVSANDGKSRPVGDIGKIFNTSNFMDLDLLSKAWDMNSYTINLTYTNIDFSDYGKCKTGFPAALMKNYTHGKFFYSTFDQWNIYSNVPYGEKASEKFRSVCVDEAYDTETKAWQYLVTFNFTVPYWNFTIPMFTCLEIKNLTSDHSVLVDRYQVFSSIEKGMMLTVDQCKKYGFNKVKEFSVVTSFSQNEVRDLGYNLPMVLEFLNASKDLGGELYQKIDKDTTNALKKMFPYNIHSVKRPAIQCPMKFANGSQLMGSFQLSANGSSQCLNDLTSYVNVSTNSIVVRSCLSPYPVTFTCTGSWKAADVLPMDDGLGDFVLMQMNSGNETAHDITSFLVRWRNVGNMIYSTVDERNVFGLTPGFSMKMGANNTMSRPAGDLSQIFNGTALMQLGKAAVWPVNTYAFDLSSSSNLNFTDLTPKCQDFPAAWQSKKYYDGKFTYIKFGPQDVYRRTYNNKVQMATTCVHSAVSPAGKSLYLMKFDSKNSNLTAGLDANVPAFGCFEVGSVTADASVLATRGVFPIKAGLKNAAECMRELALTSDFTFLMSYEDSQLRDQGYNIPQMLQYFNSTTNAAGVGSAFYQKIPKTLVDGITASWPYNFYSVKKDAVTCPWNIGFNSQLTGSYQLTLNGTLYCNNNPLSHGNLTSTGLSFRTCKLPIVESISASMDCIASFSAESFLGKDDGLGDFVIYQQNTNVTHHATNFYTARWMRNSTVLSNMVDSRNLYASSAPGFETKLGSIGPGQAAGDIIAQLFSGASVTNTSKPWSVDNYVLHLTKTNVNVSVIINSYQTTTLDPNTGLGSNHGNGVSTWHTLIYLAIVAVLQLLRAF